MSSVTPKREGSNQAPVPDDYGFANMKRLEAERDKARHEAELEKIEFQRKQEAARHAAALQDIDRKQKAQAEASQREQELRLEDVARRRRQAQRDEQLEKAEHEAELAQFEHRKKYYKPKPSSENAY